MPATVTESVAIANPGAYRAHLVAPTKGLLAPAERPDTLVDAQ